MLTIASLFILGYSSVSSVLNAKKKAKAPAPSSHEIQHYSQDLLVSSFIFKKFLFYFHVLILNKYLFFSVFWTNDAVGCC